MATGAAPGKELTANAAVDPRAANAVTHGLTAEAVLESERKEYESTFAALQDTYEVKSAIEGAWLRRIARLIVRLDRAARIDAVTFAECFGGDAGEAGMSPLRFERFMATVARYELEIGRALAKAQHEFERLQRATRGEASVAPIMVDFTW